MTRCRRHLVRLSLLLSVALPLACGGSDFEDDRRHEAALSDSAQLARGRYLVEGLLQCMICHSERDWEAPGAPPVEGRKGAGRVIQRDGEYRIVAPNLTPDPETGAGEWTDEQLIRAIRRGIGHDGRPLHPLMYYDKFRRLTDADVKAVVAYLRSLEPVRNPLPPTRLSPEQRERAESRSPASLDPIDLASLDSLERGRALVILGDCIGCHTGWRAPRRAPELAGGNRIMRGERSAFSTNLTPHPSGMPYDAETFINVIRTGKGGTLHPLMPWIVFRELTEEDLRLVHAYLRTRFPAAHHVDNRTEPTSCSVCGQRHGLGELNEMQTPEGIALDPARYERYTGAYVRKSEPDDTLTVEAGDSGLVLRFGDSPPLDVVPVSDDRVLVPGMLRAPLRFEFDGDSQAARAVYETVEPEVLVRVAEDTDGGS